MPVLAEARERLRGPDPAEHEALGPRRPVGERDVEARVGAEVDPQALVARLEHGAAVVAVEAQSEAGAGDRHAVDHRLADEAAGVRGHREQPPCPARRVAVDRDEHDDDDAPARLRDAPEVALHPDAVVAARVAPRGIGARGAVAGRHGGAHASTRVVSVCPMSRAGEALAGALAPDGAASGRSAPALLWRFSRPHTIVGTTLSVLALFAIATTAFPGEALGAELFDLFWTLVAAWCVNIFIVGINQLEDVEIDRINKPFLPVAAGDLSPAAGRRIVVACAVIPLVLAVTQGVAELVAVALGLAIGTAYSVPPLRLKRFPALASLSITFVRSVVVNVGVWLHFSHAFGGGSSIHPAVWALIAVTVPFSFAIAILKDMPDVEGDRRYAIATFSVRLGARPVFAIGLAVLTLGELGMATVGAALLDGANTAVLVGGHLAACAVLWVCALRTDLGDRAAITRFYMRVWLLFFAEYAIVAAAYLLG